MSDFAGRFHVALLTLMLGAFSALAPAQVLVGTLTASDAGTQSYFGTGMAIQGDTLVVGAPGNSTDVFGAGSVYVFTRNPDSTWSQSQRLSAPVPMGNGRFGTCVALSGDLLVVGAPGHTTSGVLNGGSVVLFRRQADRTFLFEHEIQLSSPSSADQFGTAVSVNNGVVVVGASVDATAGANAGAVYVYNKGSGVWALEATLTDSSLLGLGSSLDFDGNTLAMGAPSTFTGFGAVLLATRDAPGVWSNLFTIAGFNAGVFSGYGSSVDLRGNTLLAGAPFSDSSGATAGASLIYTRTGVNTWGFDQIILPTSKARNSRFGHSVSLTSGDAVVITQTPSSASGVGRFVVYFSDFSRTFRWLSTQNDPALSSGALFGDQALVSGTTLVVSAPADDIGFIDSGTVYLYEMSGLEGDCNGNMNLDLFDIRDGLAADCNDNLVPDSCDIANGTSLDVNGNGVPDECETPPACPADMNGDGILDNGDISVFISLFLAGC